LNPFILLSVFFGVFVGKAIEPVYVYFYGKPLFIHFYPIPKKLKPFELEILNANFHYYSNLSPRKKKFFDHRVATFIQNYQFIPKEGIEISTEMKILIAATAIKLSFGMRNYLVKVFDKIIIYPESYYSMVNEVWHKGEFNPRMKAIVFSWEDFLAGYEHDNDNLNLGLHEFAHAYHLHGLKSSDVSAIIFAETYKQIISYTAKPEIRTKLITSNYFRIYAYTNSFEFIAVLLEHFFETPEQFEIEFPELFQKVRKMINF
jgi:Mlc titration factor MtfA (ptsG expression regulator)